VVPEPPEAGAWVEVGAATAVVVAPPPEAGRPAPATSTVADEPPAAAIGGAGGGTRSGMTTAPPPAPAIAPPPPPSGCAGVKAGEKAPDAGAESAPPSSRISQSPVGAGAFGGVMTTLAAGVGGTGRCGTIAALGCPADGGSGGRGVRAWNSAGRGASEANAPGNAPPMAVSPNARNLPSHRSNAATRTASWRRRRSV
jgi:hypothetical protein